MTSQLVCTVPEAGALMGLGRWGAYEASKRGDIEVIEIGRLQKVTIAWLADRLGVGREVVVAELEALRAQQTAA